LDFINLLKIICAFVPAISPWFAVGDFAQKQTNHRRPCAKPKGSAMKAQNTSKNNQRSTANTLSALAAVAMLLSAAFPAWAGGGNDGNPGILPPQSSAFGASYAEWSAKWWQWTLSFPANADPANDTAPLDSAQSGNVWFLPGAHGSAIVSSSTVVSRTATVPSGKALFFPIIATWVDNSGCPTYTDFSEAELRSRAAASFTFVSEASCTIDGVPVQGLSDPQSTPYRVQSQAFDYTLASTDNLLAADFGEPCIPDGTTVSPAVSDGVFLMVAPLSVGEHTIRFIGVVGPLDSPFFSLDITYHLTVLPGQAN
jgi:hypothetical protein